MGEKRIFISLLYPGRYPCSARDLRTALGPRAALSCVARRDHARQLEKIDLFEDVLAIFKHHLDLHFLLCLFIGGCMIDPHHGWNASLKPQFIGFVISFVLLISVYRIVTPHHLSDGLLYATICLSALAQALAQLVFFMHLGLESKPRWNTITFLFTLLVIVLIIGGSLLIMNNLR